MLTPRVLSNYALTDESIVNLNSLIPLSDINPYLYLALTEVYNATTHGLLFDWLQVKISQRFAINIKNSSGHYLHSNYSTEKLIAGVSDTG